MYSLKGKRVLVTGACGTVGSALIEELLSNEAYGVGELVGIDNNESATFSLDQRYLKDSRARFLIGDVRDRNLMLRLTQGVDVIFHSAALKHVIICERSPLDAVQTNIVGVENITGPPSKTGWTGLSR